MKCPICGTEQKGIFIHKILKKYDVQYYKCEKCGVICPESPYQLEEAYSTAINCFDTGIMNRNEQMRRKIFNLICLCFDNSGKYRDYGGGHGILTRMMRDWGIDYYWSDKYGENLFARGFEFKENMKVELTSAIEVFEHMVTPMEDISDILKYTDSLFFTTLPYTTVVGDDQYPSSDWWYYGFQHGQHVMIYSKKTLLYIAEYFGLNFYEITNATHLISAKKYKESYWNYVQKNLRKDFAVNYRRNKFGGNFAQADMNKLIRDSENNQIAGDKQK